MAQQETKAGPARVAPLQRADPPALGSVVLTGRIQADESAVVFAGEQAGEPVVVVMLTVGAAEDSFARARFHAAVDARLTDGGAVVDQELEPDFAPWVAVRADSYDAALSAAGPLVATLTVAEHEPAGRHRGPAFAPHWYRRATLGRWRLWPLPWPRWLRSAGIWTFAAAFALCLAIAAAALLISVLVLRTLPTPPTPPTPPSGPSLPVPPVPVPAPTRSNPPSTPPSSGPTPSSPGPQRSNGPRSGVPPII
jgi:hypothetical protein